MGLLTPEQEEEQLQRLRGGFTPLGVPEDQALGTGSTPAAAMPEASAAAAQRPVIAKPNALPRGVTLPQGQDETSRSMMPTQLQRDQENLTHETSIQPKIWRPGGADGVKNPILRALLRVGDVAGTALFPAITGQIPGTALHHRLEVQGAQGRVNQDIAGQNREAETAEANARTQSLLNPQPKPKEEQWSVVPGVTSPDGKVLQEEKNSGQLRWADSISGVQPLKPPAEKTPNDFEQYYHDLLTDNHWPDTAHNRLLARKQYAESSRAPEHEPHQLAVGPDGTVLELKPGMKVPVGTKTAAKYGEPTADEQRRADLSENLNENLQQLEDIVTRRPELFGPMAGRYTGLKQMLGTNDPDIAALATIQHQLGMAQISAHGMRSAHGIEAAADSIMNSFHNEPGAIKAAIAAARKSVGTFTKDVAKAKGEQGGDDGETVEWVKDANGKLVPKK